MKIELKNKIEMVDEFLKKAANNYDLPGLAVGIYGGAGNEYKNAVGYKDYIAKKPMDKNNIFHCASVTKLLTGTSVMQLDEQGAIDIEGKIKEYLPWFEMDDPRFLDITVKQMLSHTSGLPDVEDYHWDKPETDEGALERFCKSEEVKACNLLWNPDENRFAYSNIAYELLGSLVATVSGMPYEEYVKRNIFVPLGMNNSTLLTFQRDMSEVCTPHGKDEEKHIIKEKFFPYNRAHGPSSTLTSNVEDLEKLAKGFIDILNEDNDGNQSIISKECLLNAWEEIALVPNNGEKICTSWFKRMQGEYILYGHEGTDDGFRASFWICPELELSISVLSNISNAPVKKISKQIFELLLK